MSLKLSRRAALRLAGRAAVALGAAGIVGAGYTLYGEPGSLFVERVSVPIRGLPLALDGRRIAQLTDLHVSEFVGEEHVEQAVALAMRARPDLIALTGDYVSGKMNDVTARVYRRAIGRLDGRSYVQIAGRALAGLSAPLGVYAVLGNHDHWSDHKRELIEELARAGAHVLRNEHVRIETRGERIWLAGVDDALVRRANFDQALRGVGEDGFRMLLAHEPDVADIAARHAIQLQLSGHTHGGQVRLPVLGALELPQLGRRYPIGLQRVRGTDTLVYTSRGVGVTSPPVRFNCPPEVTVITLRQA